MYSKKENDQLATCNRALCIFSAFIVYMYTCIYIFFIDNLIYRLLELLTVHITNIRDTYYRPPEGGRLYDMKVVSGYAFLRTYFV